MTKFILVFLWPALFFGLLSCDKENKPDSKTENLTAELSKAPSSINFVVQIAALRDSGNAEDLKTILQQSNLPTTVSAETGLAEGKIFRVQVGPYSSEKEAVDARKTVIELGFTDAFLKLAPVQNVQENSIKVHVENLNKKQLTFSGGCESPKWSPSGREIAFFKNENGIQGLYSIGTGGGPVSKIIENDPDLQITSKFAWSRTGDKIVFVTEEVNRDFEKVENLYVVNKSGRGLKKIFTQQNLAFKIADLKWSPNGKFIAFSANRSDSDFFQRILILDLDNENIIEPDKWQNENRAVGWKSENEFLFLSAYERVHDFDDRLDEIWSYEVNRNQTTRNSSKSIISNCQLIELLPDPNFLIYASKKQNAGAQILKIAILHLNTGAENVLFLNEFESDFSYSFQFSNDNKIFFLINNQLWVNEISGEQIMVSEEINASSFTVSPSGTRICFVEDGNLFSLKLDFPE